MKTKPHTFQTHTNGINNDKEKRAIKKRIFQLKKEIG